ncbi:hypothetical protein BDZ89DRAFT_543503 [Hymenopellis radicata]|nr:hypothetical protein BDZ89DRAFT_543503 [Hymenopellis radicata]
MCSSMCAMVQHSRCPLVVLEMSNVLLCDSLIPTLHALTSLESFSMRLTKHWDVAHNDLLKQLVQHLGQEHAGFLPVLGDFGLRLQNLDGHRANTLDYSFIDDKLVEVVQYRLADTPLKRITLKIEVVCGGGH